jgi:hypothetical protein
MNHQKFIYRLALVALTVVTLAGRADAQTTAVGPYYAPPAWDQTLPCATLANCPRFIVLSNMNSAAVLDRETGLVWERAPGDHNGDGVVNADDTRIQFIARGACNSLTLGNRKGWRLPSLQEILTLFDGDPSNTSSPRLPPGHPFINIQGVGAYWTSTVFEGQGGAAVFLSNGAIAFFGSALENFRWCVRGATSGNERP